MRTELEGTHPLFTLGRLMKTLGQYDHAEYFYRMLMAETTSFSSSPVEQAKLYSDLGTIYMDKRLYPQALEYFQQSLKYNPNSAECYGDLGLVYQELNQPEQALEYLHRAIELNQAIVVSPQKVAIQFNNIGTVYYKQNNFKQAKHNYEQALKLRLECLPSTHPDIAQSFSNIGAVSYAQRDFANALSSFTKAFEIKSVSLPSDHPSFAITFNNIARALASQGLYEKALPNATKAVEISTKALTENHPQTQEFITSLQKIRQQLSKLKNN
jgi:tetratricopeptide (TPR) repeat protein